jgi:8-oxo-dGTP diphosphatase
MSEIARFCIRCGTPLVLKPMHGQERPTCPACDWVYFEDPKVAAAVVVEYQGQILLTRRLYDPGSGLWTLPAGFVDAGEDPARAAERECLEETGLVVQVSSLLDVLSGREHPRGADIVLVYRAVWQSGTLTPGDDAASAAFFSRDNLPPLAFKSTRSVLLGSEEDFSQG